MENENLMYLNDLAKQQTKKIISSSYDDYDGNVISKGNELISYADADFMKKVICWIAENGEVNKRLKTELTKKRQQSVIDLCKEIKIKMCL